MFSKHFPRIYRPGSLLVNYHFSKRFANTGIEFYEPPYLESMKPKRPFYEAVTIQVTGYDFTVLEHYQRFVHSIVDFMNLKVDLCWAHPAKHYDISRQKPNSKAIDATYTLLLYERNIKLTDVPAVKLPLLAEFIQTALPEGTQLKIFPFDEVHANDRFVPDHDLIAKSKELEELGGPPEDIPPNQS